MLLVPLTIKCPHHAHAGQTLIQNEIEFIQLRLHAAEQRDGLTHQNDDGGHKNRNDHHQDPGESGILVNRENNPGNQCERGSDHDIQRYDQHLLHLRRIVGGAGNQRGRTHSVELMQRKLLHVSKKLGTDNFAKASRHLGREENADDGSKDAPHRHQQHDSAGSPDIAGIALDNPIIYDICHQIG